MSEEQKSVKDVRAKDGPDGMSTSAGSLPAGSSKLSASNNNLGQKPRMETRKNEEIITIEDDTDGDSEAETLIQSPEKKRNVIDNVPSLRPTNGSVSAHIVVNVPKVDVISRKRKRSLNDNQIGPFSPTDSHRSSPLSSPVAAARSDVSDSEKSSSKKYRKADRPRNRRSGRGPSVELEDKIDSPNLRKRQPSDAATHHGHKREKSTADPTERRETRSATYPRHSDTERSPSPPSLTKREHRRGASTQLTSHELERKKRARPTLISTQRHRSVDRARSSDSDRSNSPVPPRSALHKFTSHDQDTMSPIKSGPKKRRDKNGRTAVARHANSGNLEGVKTELAEHREDLNLADNAGNTPLQIAALEGHIEIVEYLLSQGCEVDTRNIDKDTPLIDAVENGHVEVIKLLLDYGANPRVGNAKGDEPYELVPEDDDNYVAIRKLLAGAKERSATKHRGQEQGEGNNRDGNSSRAASAASPRDSPPVGPRSPPAFSSRRRTGRSESTRNDLLWQAHNQPALTKLAGKGDVQGVANILNILQKAETESLIAAAKAGHEEVLQLLTAMGDPNPDPSPVKSLPPGYNTPLLAAIGRGHVDVVKLLISQSGFDPTRKLYGRYYFELARERKGTNWQQEYEVLKSAYDNYAAGKIRKHTSPRKTRDPDKTKRRTMRRSASPTSQSRTSSSPTITHKSLPSKSADSSPKDKRKLLDGNEKRKISATKIEHVENSAAVLSDLEQTVTVPRKGHRPRRSQSDLPAPQSMEGDVPYRRRRLVMGKEHRRNQSAAPGSASEDEELLDMIEVKQEERPTTTLKRSRSSNSVGPKPFDDNERNRSGVKKRRMVESSPEEGRSHPRKTSSAVGGQKSSTSAEERDTQNNKPRSDFPPPVTTGVTSVKTEDSRANASSYSFLNDYYVSEGRLVEREPHDNEQAKTKDQTLVDETDSTIVVASTNIQDSTNGESSASLSEAVQNEAAREAAREAAKEAEAEAYRLAAEEAKKAALEEALRRAEAERRAIQQREEAEAQAALAAKKLAAEEALAKKRAEEEAQRKKEEEERQEQKRREMDMRRRQQDLEMERRRLSKLPAALSKTAVLINDNDPLARDEKWLREKFLPLLTVTTQQLDPQIPGPPTSEKWVPNYQVAGLLATKDLNLRAYTSIEKRPVSPHQRVRLWGVSRIQLSFDYLMNWGLGISHEESLQREKENREKFMAMDEVFWVKLSDFEDQVSRYPHLSGLKLQTQPISLKIWKDIPADAPASNTSKTPLKLVNGSHLSGSLVTNSVNQ